MATVKDSIPHIVRTANDPRGTGLHRALISRIELVNEKIRVLRLSLPDGPVRHLPGQYVDLHIPEVQTVGGFTITSPPQTALAPRINRNPQSIAQDTTNQQDPHPFIELAIQKSPNNPPAAYLWRPPPEILNTPTSIRIGGSFTYPPQTLSLAEFQSVNNVVFIAGGVGINPIISMLSAMDMLSSNVNGYRPGGFPQRMRILYSSRRGMQSSLSLSTSAAASTSTSASSASRSNSTNNKRQKEKGEEILFEKRLQFLAKKYTTSPTIDFQYLFFETNASPPTDSADNPTHLEPEHSEEVNIQTFRRRMTHADLFTALGPEDLRPTSLVYICGLPGMTDEYVDLLRGLKGLDETRVLCEKWW